MRILKSSLLLGSVLACLTATQSFSQIRPYSYDTPSFIDIESTEVSVPEDAGSVAINLYRTGEFRQNTTINYKTVAGNASEGSDYKGAGGTVTFKPGEGFKTVLIEIMPDANGEANEDFAVQISTDDPNALIMRESVKVTIEDQSRPISGQPQLEIIPGPENTIILGWEGSASHSIERTLNPASGWEPVQCEKSVRGARCEVTQPAGGPLYFYRLRAE